MKLQNYFPFKSIRTLQIETMKKIDDAYAKGKRFVIVEAPTGFGKSPVVLAVAKKYGPAHVMTPQKILQKQYIRDFSNDMYVMKGKGNYYCEDLDRWCGKKDCKKPPAMYCSGNFVHTSGEVTTDEQIREWHLEEALSDKMTLEGDAFSYKGRIYELDSCTYRQNVMASRISEITLHNFHSFIYQSCLSPVPVHHPRNILIVDEAHNIENVCMDSFTIMLSNKLFNGEEFPHFWSLDDLIEYFDKEDYKNTILKYRKNLEMFDFRPRTWTRLTYLTMMMNYYEMTNQDKLSKEYERLITKVNRFISYYRMKDEDGKPIAEFVFESETVKGEQKVHVKPVYIKFWMSVLFNKADLIFLTSATILDKKQYCRNLGIPLDKTEFIQMPSEFPKENRVIWALPQGSMSAKNIDETLPKAIAMVKKIMFSDKYKNKKGIIHTHTFKIAQYIKDHIKSKRLLFVEDFADRNDMIDHHFKSKNTILVAPALHEGLDLKDDHGRFQIIMKVPYPYLGDIQINERAVKRKEWDWYGWNTALKIVQAYGRCVRHKDDYADTYVLDSDFINFVYGSGTRKFLPDWFVEAVKIKR